MRRNTSVRWTARAWAILWAMATVVGRMDSCAVLAFSSPAPPPPPATTKTTTKKGRDPDYLTYKTFKKLGLPAMAYSLVTKAGTRLLGLRPREVFAVPEATSPRRRVALVTGSNTGVGFETARSLVRDHEFEVVVACRSTEKGVRACRAINAEHNGKGGMAVFVQPVDLADQESVRGFAAAILERYDRIDVLVNNAGRNSAAAAEPPTNASDESSGPSGDRTAPPTVAMEVVFATNFLGHFLLTNLLLDRCSRVVNLSSVMHHFPTFSKEEHPMDAETDAGEIRSVVDYPGFWRKAATSGMKKTYAPSKLAALLFSVELNRRYADQRPGFRSLAVNPGAVNSDIWRNYPGYMKRLYRLLYLTAKQGSSTSVAASVMDFEDPNTVYLQPYRLPVRYQKREQRRRRRGDQNAQALPPPPPFPLFEMLGPYEGFVETQPRLPSHDGGIRACQSLFEVCEELTGCKYEPLDSVTSSK